MNIAIFVDDYLPDSTKVAAKMIHELAREYISMGHKVTVFVPDSKIIISRKETTFDGINVVSFKNGEVKHCNKLIRAINELSLSINAWLKLKNYFKSNHHDLIIYYSPTIFFGTIVNYLKKLWHCESYLILRDIFPTWAVDQGHIKKGSLIHHFFSYFEIKNYDAATTIGLQSVKNKEMFDERFNCGYKTECLYNWAKITPLSTSQSNIRDKYNLHDKVIFFYGGNMGTAQDMMNLVRLAEAMVVQPNAFFLFVGSGDEVDLMERNIARMELKNTMLLPSVNQTEFINILSECDIGMFSLSRSHTNHNFPGKILAYMQQEKAVLGSVNVGNDIINLFDKYNAGLISENGDYTALFNDAVSLIEQNRRKELARNASTVLKCEFSVKNAALHILDFPE